MKFIEKKISCKNNIGIIRNLENKFHDENCFNYNNITFISIIQSYILLVFVKVQTSPDQIHYERHFLFIYYYFLCDKPVLERIYIEHRHWHLEKV